MRLPKRKSFWRNSFSPLNHDYGPETFWETSKSAAETSIGVGNLHFGAIS